MGWLGRAVALCLLASVALGAPVFYDEIFDTNGLVRPQYAEAWAMLGHLAPEQKLALIREAKRRFSGDTPMAPMPRILTVTEWETLAKGTRQRAEALRRFLVDHYSGKRTYRDTVIPARIIDEIIERSGEGPLADYIKGDFAKRMRFLYGPDVIRKADGSYVVLEDNTGFVGAPGDIGPAREIFEVMYPELASRLDIQNNPNDWYSDLQDRYTALARPALGHRDTDGALVVYGSPPYGDKEDVRLHDILKDRGAILVTPNTRDRRIVVEDDGVYVEYKGRFGKLYKKRIGFLWLNSEHAWADWNHPGIREKALLDEARAHLAEEKLLKKHRAAIEAAIVRDPETRKLDLDRLERVLRESNYFHETSDRRGSLIPGLMAAILDGRVQTNYTPGAEFVGDKMFHTFVDDLVRFYLGEEPILRSAPSGRFVKLVGGRLVTDHAAIRRAMGARATSVIKIVDGRGGDDIHIGPKMTETEWKKLRERIFADPSRWIIQEYSHPSVVDDRIVDIRMISFVDEGRRHLVSYTPWCRSNVIRGGDGKVNMSKHGTLMVVLVVPDAPASCAGRTAARARGRRGR